MSLGIEGRRRRKRREQIYGKPTHSATLVRSSVNRSTWTYRGVTLEGRRLVGWGAGWEWTALGRSTSTRRDLMAVVDASLNT